MYAFQLSVAQKNYEMLHKNVFLETRYNLTN